MQRVCDAATRGPWFRNAGGEVNCIVSSGKGGIAPVIATANPMMSFSHAYPCSNIECNFDFIAAARTALPVCIAEIRRLREALKEYENPRHRDLMEGFE